MKLAACAILVLLLSFVSTMLPYPLYAFSSSNVPIEDPVYYELAKLTGYGLIKSSVYGQRPWSRNEIARQIAEAMQRRTKLCAEAKSGEVESEKCQYIDSVLLRLKEEFRRTA